MIKAKHNLIGQTFGRLVVISQTEDYISPKGYCAVQWLCKCKCNTLKVLRSSDLVSGKVSSCGCLQKELFSQHTKERLKRYNDYEVQEDYVIMYTTKGEPFYVDIEDFWKVKDVCWHIRKKDKYVYGKILDDPVLLHRYIMGCPTDLKVDHIGGSTTRNDNRKQNLRVCTQGQNCMNRVLSSKNKYGCNGIAYIERLDKYQASIDYNGERLYLGIYSTLEEAIVARKSAEDKYFGEFSYDNSQKLAKERSQE